MVPSRLWATKISNWPFLQILALGGQPIQQIPSLPPNNGNWIFKSDIRIESIPDRSPSDRPPQLQPHCTLPPANLCSSCMNLFSHVSNKLPTCSYEYNWSTQYNFSYYHFHFTYLCSEPFSRTSYLLDGLPSIWAGTGVKYNGRPSYLTAHRKDGTGPIHSKSK